MSGPEHVVLPYQRAGRSVVVEALINGRRPGRLLLDTGASLTVISRRLAREVDLSLDPGAARVTLQTANGPIQALLATLDAVRVGAAEVNHVLVAVHDVPGLGSEIDGLLGMTFLRHFRLTIDPERRELTLGRRSEAGAR